MQVVVIDRIWNLKFSMTFSKTLRPAWHVFQVVNAIRLELYLLHSFERMCQVCKLCGWKWMLNLCSVANHSSQTGVPEMFSCHGTTDWEHSCGINRVRENANWLGVSGNDWSVIDDTNVNCFPRLFSCHEITDPDGVKHRRADWECKQHLGKCDPIRRY